MAIQQHPLPQDISSYRFRLIGDMTIKQFASLGISIVIGLIVYSLPLPFFFRYPLSFFFIILGVGMAFVPVQGRSLDIWILAFIKSIYSPTQYVWKKSEGNTTDTNMPSLQNNSQPPTATNPQIEITSGTPSSSQPQSISTPTPIPPSESKPETSSSSEDIITPAPPSTPSTPPATSSPDTNLSPTEETPPSPITPPSPVSSPSPSVENTPSQAQLPIPFTPTSPNTLVGLTLTPKGTVLDGVLIEIKSNGLTSRATKSNKLGQFLFARPLENGTYQIISEKDGYLFPPYSLELTGAIVKPLKIQAQ